MKFQSFDQKIEVYKKIPTILSLLIGASIGFVSGVVGIGGGIFLSPILLLIKAGKTKDIATSATIFILINSIAGYIALTIHVCKVERCLNNVRKST